MTFQKYITKEKIVQNNIRLRQKLKIPLNERTKLTSTQTLEQICDGSLNLSILKRQYCFSNRLQCPYKLENDKNQLPPCARYYVQGFYSIH